MSLKLIYFKMRALAEAPQMLLNYLGIEYEYLMSWDYYDDEWKSVKPKITFKQLPVLIVNNEYEIAQSLAILSYIEKIAGIDVGDPITLAKADAISYGAQELFSPLNPTVNFATGDDFKSKREEMKSFLLSRFDDLSRVINSGGKKFFIEDKPRACDFVAFHHLDLSRELDSSLIKEFPRLQKFMDDISTIDSVSSYLKNRPVLIDVSVAPKLIIDGQPQSTGIKKS
ncbi:glutathione S-transferase [Alphaproteobacteria bacterium]|nr:glutathione S-transferase [Alphaproteobacteria bacterium]